MSAPLLPDILARLHRAPGRWTVRQLAAAHGLSDRAAADLVLRLMEQGLVERAPLATDEDLRMTALRAVPVPR